MVAIKLYMLTNIITDAFDENKAKSEEEKEYLRKNRVFFTSRKTLLNEFNHFEGNMNIFQPAIDISEEALKKEIKDINCKLKNVREYYTR